MDFNEKWEVLMKEYESKLSIPNWFIDGSKTLLSRNVTIEDWNKVYSYLSRMASDNTVLLKLLEVLKTFVMSNDSKLYEDVLTAQQTATVALDKINEILLDSVPTPNTPIKTYRKELYGSDWLRIAKVKDVFKNSSGIFTINLYGNYIEKNNLAPIPNTGTLSEINIDTSKTIEETKAILNTLTTYVENDNYGTTYILSEGKDVWYWLAVLKKDNTYEIWYMDDDDDDIPLFTENDGWNLDAIIDGKFTLPKVANEVKEGNGLENDKLIDLMWVGEYRPSHTEVLTTSVFNVSCGLNAKEEFISDVLPITQAPTLSSADSSGGAGSGAGSGEATGTYGLTAISLEKTSDDEIYVNGLFNFPATELLFNYVNVELKIENNLNFEYLDDITIKEIEDCNAIQTGTILKANTQYYVTLEGSLSELKKIGSVALEIADTSGTTEFWEPIKYTSNVDSNEWLMAFWDSGDVSNTGISTLSLYFESTTLKGDMLRKQFSNDRLKVLNLVIQVLAGTVYKNGELIGSIFSVSDDDIIEIVAPNNSRAGISLYSTSTIQILTSYIDTVDRYVLDIYTYDNFIGKTIRLLATADSDYSESYDLFSIYTALKDSKKPLYKHRIVISPVFDSSSKFFLEFYNYSEEPYNYSKVIDYLNTHVASIGNTLHLDSYCPEYGHLSIAYNPYQEAVITATVYKFTEQTLKTHTYSTWNYFINGAYDDVIPVDGVIIS